jgi:BirA family biotin operon repressor/biotin-[acetyl-CoA-carboxylase] ligase
MSGATINNPDARLLGALLEAGDNFVSGNDLAHLLGISRPAVWARLQRLESAGFKFQAVRNRGHRLLQQPASLHPALLDWWAHVKGISFPFLYFPTIDSTNTEAERQFQDGRNAPFVVVSSQQTAGRGRRGRTWISESADNLYLTLALEPQLSPRILSGFTLWAGIHLARGLNAGFMTQVKEGEDRAIGLKWPNDLESGGRKLGGLLTEAKSDSDGIRQLVVGFGLNVGMRPQLERGIALAEIAAGKTIGLSRLAVDCASWLIEAYDAMLNGKDADGLSLPEAYAQLDALDGKVVQAYRNREKITGKAAGVDTSGALLLLQCTGGRVAVDAGEVTLQAE